MSLLWATLFMGLFLLLFFLIHLSIFLIEVKLLYNVMLVSSVHKSDSIHSVFQSPFKVIFDRYVNF